MILYKKVPKAFPEKEEKTVRALNIDILPNIWLILPYMRGRKASLVIHDKILLKSGVIVEIKIWDVSSDKRYPDRYKYSLYAVYGDEVLVGYDNHYPKGHHRHIGNREEEYNFTTFKN